MFVRFSVLLVSLCLFTACQQEITGVLDVEPVNPPPAGKGSFTAKIDGVAWRADRGAGASFNVAANGLPALLNITGVGNDKKIISMMVEEKGVQTYTLTGTSFNTGVFQDSSLPDRNAFTSHLVAQQPSGTVRITKIDEAKKTVSGTFEFKVLRATDQQARTITDGVFTDIPYTTGLTANPAAAKDTFRVKVDGAPFEPYSITGLYTALNNSISVQGSNQAVTKTVGVIFPANIEPGSYTFDLFGATYLGIYLSGTATFSAQSGTLEILEHNKTTKRVRGNFNFKGETIPAGNTSAQITEGYFSVVYK